MPNVSLHHPVMHIVFFRKTDRLASQPLNVRPEIQVLSLDFLRLFLCDRVLLELSQKLREGSLSSEVITGFTIDVKDIFAKG